MATAVYSGRGWVLKVRQTGTLLLRGKPTEVTDREVEILRGFDGVTIAEGESLGDLSRAALNERAEAAGVEAPAKLPNKQAVIDAIKKRGG